MTTTIQISHGSGGSMMHDLIASIMLPAFDNPFLRQGNDQAVIPMTGGRLAFSTDAYVVDPLFFPGGSIGHLAVHGTINDVAMCGAMPVGLSAAFILEEGLPMETLERVVADMRDAANAAGVPIVTGDTKVVGRGSCDGMYITTAGIGIVPDGVHLDGGRICAGDAVILSGPVGNHGVAVASQRRGMVFETPVLSDTAALHRLVAAMLDASGGIHAMRDPTRGGLAATLNELAVQARVGVEVEEDAIAIDAGVRTACAIFGFDPLQLACEGALIAFVAPGDADAVLQAMRSRPEGASAAIIGHVLDDRPGGVRMRTSIGGRRLIPMPAGEILPRIC